MSVEGIRAGGRCEFERMNNRTPKSGKQDSDAVTKAFGVYSEVAGNAMKKGVARLNSKAAKVQKDVYGRSPIKRSRMSKADIVGIETGFYEFVAENKPCTVRQCFYYASTRGWVPKTELAYKTIGRILVNMRRAGDIPYSWLSDYSRQRHKPRSHSSLESALESTQRHYRHSLWDDQKQYCEIWIEKSALLGVVYPVTSALDAWVAPTRGYPSLTFLAEAAEDIADISKPTSIFYFGDWDPSGVHIAEKIEEELHNFAPNADITFHRSAVNRWQISEWDLPSRPTKKSDSRAKNFEGDSVELDAIPPAQLRELVQSKIESCIDPDVLERTKRVEEAEKYTLDGILQRMYQGEFKVEE